MTGCIPFSTALRIAQEKKAAAVAATERHTEIGREITATDHRLGDLEGALKSDAAKAALKGLLLDPKATARRREMIADARGHLEGLEAARPLAAAAARAAEVEHAAAQRDLSAVAIPHFHRELRLPAVTGLQEPLTAFCNALAPIKAVDIVQRHFGGDQPFIRAIPESFFFAEPLVDRLIVAIPPQFADRETLSREIDRMAKEIAEAEIKKMEKANG